jgi:hypothetical protein
MPSTIGQCSSRLESREANHHQRTSPDAYLIKKSGTKSKYRRYSRAEMEKRLRSFKHLDGELIVG